MSEKISLVFDTNFIVSHIPRMEEVYKKLSETYNVFISEVSIQERISHRYLELKEKYENIEKIKIDCVDLADISLKKSFEEKWENLKIAMQEKYRELFGKNILEFISHQDTLNTLMDRAFRKIPPFNTAEKASDKGFKDTLIWLSILEYFQHNGGNKVYFVTDDKAFKNNSLVLCKEFNEKTGKNIEIKENDFYVSSVKKEVEADIIENKSLPDFSLIRKRIHEEISALCYGYYAEDNYGNDIWRKTFSLNTKATEDDMRTVFGDLRKIIKTNVFDTSLPANTVFTINNIENDCNIPMDILQRALDLYDHICKEYNEYLQQFFIASANIFNTNYDPNSFVDDIPF